MCSFFYFQGSKIHYKIKGSGPTLVLLHGYLQDLGMWKKIANKLSQTHQVIAIDLPGFGKSDCLQEEHSMNLFAVCVHAILFELKLQNIILIGHSMGAYVALCLLKICPKNIVHFCLFHSTANADSVEKKAERTRLIKVVRDKKKAYLKTAIPSLFSEKYKNENPLDIKKMIEQSFLIDTKAIYAALKGMQQREDRNELLRLWPGKKTYIAGALDPLFSIGDLRKEATRNNAEFIEIVEAGHMSHLENTDVAIKVFEKVVEI